MAEVVRIVDRGVQADVHRGAVAVQFRAVAQQGVQVPFAGCRAGEREHGGRSAAGRGGRGRLDPGHQMAMRVDAAGQDIAARGVQVRAAAAS